MKKIAIAILFFGGVMVVCLTLSSIKRPKETLVPPRSGVYFYAPVAPVDVKAVTASRTGIVLNAIKAPTAAADLVNGKYALTIERAATRQVLLGRLPVSQEPNLVNALRGIVMIESGGNCLALSHKGAAGIMQMMPKTARENGLKVGGTNQTSQLVTLAVGGNHNAYEKLVVLDQRFDPYRSIRAGAHHLVSLYRHYGRWDFAIAAYHGGQGNIDKLIVSYLLADNQVTYFFGWHIRDDVDRTGISYPRIFLDSDPNDHPESFQTLLKYKSARFDFSGWYFWDVKAAQRVADLGRKKQIQSNQRG